MKNNRIKKQDAANAVDMARGLTFQAGRLREIADTIEGNHDDRECANAHHDVSLLRSIAEERSSEAYDALDYADDYFRQQPKKRTKKKLALVKKAA
jgi:hypothetical protein